MIGNDWPVGPARGAALLVVGLSLLACVAAFASGLPILLQTFLALAALVAGSLAVKRLLRPGIRSLKVEGRRLRVIKASGQAHAGQLLGLPFVSPVYVGFRWRPDRARLSSSIGIFRAQLKAADFRRLCSELRQGGET